MNRLTNRQRFLVALTLFGMFFGAGNLIFPVHLGQLAGKNAVIAVVGFFITAVGIPILSVAAIGNTHSDSLHVLAGRVGRRYSYFFTVLLYLTVGPLFAIPRCASTSFTVGIAPILSQGINERMALLIFSVIFFAIVLFCALRPAGITIWIGKIINPVFLFFLFILLGTVFWKSDIHISTIEPTAVYLKRPLLSSAIEGYQTMDAIAGLAFGIVVVNIIRSMGVKNDEAIAHEILYAGIWTGIFMGGIYALTILMGAKSRGVFELADNGGIALAQIAQYYLGRSGAFILAAIIIFACLKTSIGLVTSCAEAFVEMFPGVFNYKIWTVIFSAVSFLFSNVGLSKIIEYSLPMLMFLYPLTITLILLALFEKVFRKSRYVYLTTTVFTCCTALVDLLNSLPEGTKERLHIGTVIETADRILPMSNAGLGWALPAIIGFAIGYLIFLKKKGRE
ncbi:MAG: branched-chain amino acid transport system II carrier protein [Eubacteriales bacterium]|nr:branched-chain amino acid transport system II carrier protein [Eubacteriales bacterium]